MSNTSTTPTPLSNHFADNFWESLDKNGITILLERMRGAKQTCEKYKHAYEARALLEEEYGKTLLQIAQKQKSSSTENGTSKSAMDSMQAEFISVAESHLHLSNSLRENIALPLSNLLIKQRALRKDLQTSIQKLHNNRQLQVHFVRRAHKRHNMEIEKANLLVQQQLTEKDKRATFKMAEMTIDKLKKVYDEAVKDLEKIVQEWNIEWRNTCESFEKLEKERLEFFKSNILSCASLMIGCLENQIQACERVNSAAVKIDVEQDLVDFVNKNKSSKVVPTPMEYIKLHAYHEANQDRGDLKHTHNALRDTIDGEDQSESEDRVHVHIQRKKSSIVSETISKANASRLAAAAAAAEAARAPEVVESHVQVEAKDSTEPVMVVGVMEVYPSGDEDDDESEFEYITESETEEEHSNDHQVETLKIKEADNEVEEKEDQAEQVVSAAANNKPSEETKQPTTPEVHQQNEKQPEATLQLQEETLPSQQDEKVSRLMSAYHQEVHKEKPSSLLAKGGFNPKRRVSFLEDTDTLAAIQPRASSSTVSYRSNNQQIVLPKDAESAKTPIPVKTLDRFLKKEQHQELMKEDEDVNDGYDTSSDAAALELDDMLRELDSKRIIREEEESIHRYRQPDIRPTSSISSPNLTQQRHQQRRSHIPFQYYQPQQQQQQQHQHQQQQYQSSRRMSTVDATQSRFSQHQYDASIRSNAGNSFLDLYDPFNSLSSKETGGSGSKNSSLSDRNMSSFKTPPSAQMVFERSLKDEKLQNSDPSSVSSSGESIHSVDQSGEYRNDKFIQDFYSVGSKTPSPNSTVSTRSSTNDGHFIDFAFALYDYEAAEEGEISFKEGDLLGIISKSEEDEQGWWEASLLNRRNQRVVRTGVVPSNFLETASQ